MALKRVKFEDFRMEQLQSNVEAALKEATGSFGEGRLISGVTVQVSPTPIDHKLGRQPQGWFLTDIRGAAIIFRAAWDDKTLTLQSSSTVTVDVWVY